LSEINVHRTGEGILICEDQEMTKEELVTSKLEAVDETETWQESVRELREVNVELGSVIDDLELRLAALEARD
jgi:hypothetical protein